MIFENRFQILINLEHVFFFCVHLSFFPKYPKYFLNTRNKILQIHIKFQQIFSQFFHMHSLYSPKFYIYPLLNRKINED